MVKEQIQNTEKHHKKSKLDQFNLSFEYNRSFSEERKMTKKRTH